MKEWVVLSKQHEDFEIALKNVRDQFKNKPEMDSLTATKVMRELVSGNNTPSNVGELSDDALKSHSLYHQYRQYVFNEGGAVTEDDEINLDSDDEDVGPARPKKRRIPVKCPLTMAPMLNPYETPCGHIFSKAGLDQYLKSRKNGQPTKCPQAACKQIGVTMKSILPVKDVAEEAKSQFMESFFGASQIE